MPISQIDRLRNSASQVILFESVKRNGVLTPVAVRPRVEGGYEIIAGRHGKLAWEAARLDTMPVIITNLDNEQAIIEMVDFGIQREEVLPSEKAAVYKIYNAGTFEGTLDTLTAMQEYLTPEETELRNMTGSVVEKLEKMGDAEFAALDLFPDFDAQSGVFLVSECFLWYHKSKNSTFFAGGA